MEKKTSFSVYVKLENEWILFQAELEENEITRVLSEVKKLKNLPEPVEVKLTKTTEELVLNAKLFFKIRKGDFSRGK